MNVYLFYEYITISELYRMIFYHLDEFSESRIPQQLFVIQDFHGFLVVTRNLLGSCYNLSNVALI